MERGDSRTGMVVSECNGTGHVEGGRGRTGHVEGERGGWSVDGGAKSSGEMNDGEMDGGEMDGGGMDGGEMDGGEMDGGEMDGGEMDGGGMDGGGRSADVVVVANFGWWRNLLEGVTNVFDFRGSFGGNGVGVCDNEVTMAVENIDKGFG